MTHFILNSKSRAHLIGFLRDMKPGDRLDLGENKAIECLPQGYRFEGDPEKGRIIFARTQDLITYLKPFLQRLPNFYRGLIVSPRANLLKGLSNLFIREGYGPIVAKDYRKAFFYTSAERPDFVVIDLCDQEREGHILISAIRKELRSHVPVIVIVKDDGDHVTESILSLGADDRVVEDAFVQTLPASIKQNLEEIYPNLPLSQ